jgi:probable rRNA maturation factor
VPASADPLVIDVLIESPQWADQPHSEVAVVRAIRAAAGLMPATGEVAVMLADDARIKALNSAWRGLDKPTNVLSFPAAATGLPRPKGGSSPLGDIAIAYETVAAEALAAGKPFLHHLMHLAIHGFLHLRGHDHETDAEAETMENLERDILRGLDVPDPYAVADEDV